MRATTPSHKRQPGHHEFASHEETEIQSFIDAIHAWTHDDISQWIDHPGLTPRWVSERGRT